MSRRHAETTGIDAAGKPGLPPEAVGSRQYTAPFVGFNDVTDSRIQTISWRVPPAEIITGELHVADSLSARQTSRPVERSRATTPAPGRPPMERMSRLLSISGDASSELGGS